MSEDQSGRVVVLTEREVAEIRLALYYRRACNHGTAGHNQYLLLAKLASALGLTLGADQVTVEGVTLEGAAVPVAPLVVLPASSGPEGPDERAR